MRKDFIYQTGISEDDIKKMDLRIKGKSKSKSKQEKKERLNEEYQKRLALLEEESDKEIQLGKAIGRNCKYCGRTSRFGTIHCCEVCKSTCGKKHGKECEAFFQVNSHQEEKRQSFGPGSRSQLDPLGARSGPIWAHWARVWTH